MKFPRLSSALNSLVRNSLSALSKFGLWIATVLISVFALILYSRSETSTEAADVGSFIAGVASALAFIWLVAGYRLQLHELVNQRRELALQRAALEQQAKELSATTSLSSLGQIHSILEEASSAIRSAELGITLPSQIMPKFFEYMPKWKVILESRSSNEVQEAYSDWLKVEGAARNYLRDVAAAMKLYIDHNRPTLQYDETKTSEEFVYTYDSWVKSAPYLSKHIGIGVLLSKWDPLESTCRHASLSIL